MSRTMKDTQEAIYKNQLASYVKTLVSAIDAASDFNLVLVESDWPWFEISMEYPPYDSVEEFQRRISADEAGAVARNIYYNIKDLFGEDYAEQIHVYHLPGNASGYREEIRKSWGSDAIVMYKKLYVKIGFFEKPSW